MTLKRLHLVDGTFELFRAHFSPRPGRTAPDGRDVKATLGIVEQMLWLLTDADEAPTHIGVAFDNPIRSFRNDLFDGYKSDEGVPEELRSQFDLAEEAIAALGLAVWSMSKFEADDALATAAARFTDRFEQVRILSPDKDLTQCIRGQSVVLVDRIRRRVIDEEAVVAQFGVPPSLIADRLALTGDTADGIPGLAGFGAKTAAALLATFGPLEKIPDSAKSWPKAVRGADKLAAVLTAGRQHALLYRTLATLSLDAPVPTDPEAMRVKSLGGPKLDALFTKLGASDGLKSLLTRAQQQRRDA
jgi:5'-3' exonuclease